MLLLDPLLLIRLRDDVLERVDALLFQFDAQLLRRLLDNARWQIDLRANSWQIVIPFALAKTIDFAIFSRSVLFPPLCLSLIWRLRLPSEAYDLEHLA